MGELLNRAGDLQPLHEDSLLPLEEDVLGPSDEASQVPPGEDIASDPEGLGVGFEHAVQFLLRAISGGITSISTSITTVSSWLYKNITQKNRWSLPLESLKDIC